MKSFLVYATIALTLALATSLGLAETTANRGYTVPDREDEISMRRYNERIGEIVQELDVDVQAVEDAGASDADLVIETNRAQVAEAAIAANLVTETNRAQVAEALLASDADLTTETNRAQVAEALLASDADLTTETNRAQVAEALLASDADLTTETNRAQVAEALLASDADLTTETNRAQVAEALLASNADLTTETNRAQVAEALLVAKADVIGSVAMSEAFNDATNGVVEMQLKTEAGANPGARYFVDVWVSETALGTVDSGDMDLASGITCGTVVEGSATNEIWRVLTDADGKIAWAFISTNPLFTNYFYCGVGGVVVGAQTVEIPGTL